MSRSFELVGLDGTNPLGFLASLGVLVTLSEKGAREVRLRWVRRHTWVPGLDGVSAATEDDLAGVVADGLRGRPVSADAERELEAVRKAMEAAKTALKKKRQELKRRRLGRAEGNEARERELRPLEEAWQARRDEYVRALRAGVPRGELALGKRVEDATREGYREVAEGLLASSGPASRDELDVLAALASDACLERGVLQPTPFEFTRGSGHQSFLEDVRQLIGCVTDRRVSQCLFRPWDYRDEGRSLRWDPVEDRRYALLDRDPSGEGARTVWMANLLAYRGLTLYTSVPTGRGLATVGWRSDEDGAMAFTWPLWEGSLAVDGVRAAVALPELVAERPENATLRARGIFAAYRARRIVVGGGTNRKINFAPARRV
ncbi:MAG TPA: OmpH family outer membrane protein [Vicinamibacterales bacterium]|nr:OmpH family outer membrane protein [Vicinamibacterales bacterium]